MSRGAFIPKAVIDTGPLFTILTLNFVRRSGFSEQKQKAILLGASIDPSIISSRARQEKYLLLFKASQLSSPLRTSSANYKDCKRASSSTTEVCSVKMRSTSG